jgi:hypothetical protein
MQEPARAHSAPEASFVRDDAEPQSLRRFLSSEYASPCSFPSGASTFRATCRCRLDLSAGHHEENQSDRARSCSCASCEHADRLSSKPHAYVCVRVIGYRAGPAVHYCARQVRSVHRGYRRRSASVCSIWMPRFPRRVRDGLPDIQGASRRLRLHDVLCSWRCFMRHRTTISPQPLRRNKTRQPATSHAFNTHRMQLALCSYNA